MNDRVPRMLEWHRADAWPKLRRVLAVGPALLTAGGVVVTVSFLRHVSVAARAASTVAGLLLVATGALVTAIGMQRLLREDFSLALRTDGVAVQGGGADVFVAWDALDLARWDDERGELVLERADGPPVAIGRRFARIDGPTLARRIEAVRRKAAMRLL